MKKKLNNIPALTVAIRPSLDNFDSGFEIQTTQKLEISQNEWVSARPFTCAGTVRLQRGDTAAEHPTQ